MTRAKNSFGSIRRFSSGRYQARYTDPDTGARHTAPATFATKRAAADWLSETRADMLRGDYLDPRGGAVLFGAYAAEHLANRVDLAPSTRELYRSQLARYVDAELIAPTGPPICLAAVEVCALDLPLIRRWHAAVSLAAGRTAAARPAAAARRGHPARLWALAAGYPVGATGRLSRVFAGRGFRVVEVASAPWCPRFAANDGQDLPGHCLCALTDELPTESAKAGRCAESNSDPTAH